MALIKCEECQKEISDKVYDCPHCGYPVRKKDEVQRVEVASINVSLNKKKKKKLLIGGLLLIISLSALLFGYKTYQEKQVEKTNQDYLTNLISLTDFMFETASTAEELLNLTYQVWYNTIYEVNDTKTDKYTKFSKSCSSCFNSDFNTSLTNLANDTTIKEQKTEILAAQMVISDSMKNLQNPPTEFQKIYDITLEIYSSYQKITDLALSPNGSLKTFSETKKAEIDNFIALYNKLQPLLP